MRGFSIHELQDKSVSSVILTKYGMALDFGEHGGVIVQTFIPPRNMKVLAQGKGLPHLDREATDAEKMNPVWTTPPSAPDYDRLRAAQDMKGVKEAAKVPEHKAEWEVPDLPGFVQDSIGSKLSPEEAERIRERRTQEAKSDAWAVETGTVETG